jgi:tetratricopeptide (TPR) repeat protein
VNLGLLYGHTGESALASQATRRAYELRNHASDEERFFIDAYYDGRATGNEEKAEQTCVKWARTYPRDVAPHSFLAGFIYPGLARYENAVQEGQESVRLNPDDAISYAILAGDELYLNRLDEAEDVVRYASDRKLDIPDFLIVRYDLAFLKNDEAEMSRVAELAQENSGAQDWVAYHMAFVFAYKGRLRDAMSMVRRATDLPNRRRIKRGPLYSKQHLQPCGKPSSETLLRRSCVPWRPWSTQTIGK